MHLDAIFRNGRITTLDPDHPDAAAIGVHAGRIVGLDGDLDGCTATYEADLRGAPVVPGFNDAHQHLSMRGRRLRELDLGSDAVRSLDELYAAVARRAESLPAGAWLRGAGYDQNKIGAHPTADALDRVSGGRPVWLEHCSGHMCVVNSAAFARMGHADRTAVPDVPGGHVERDADGRATGLLQEKAQGLVQRVLLPAPADEYLACIAEASRVGLSEGLTSATEPGIGTSDGIGNGPADLHAFLTARETGALGVRMTLMPYITALRDMGAFEPGGKWFGLDLGVRTGLGDEWVRVGPTKILADGSLIGRSAAMCCDYHDDPGNSGFYQFDPAELHRLILDAHRCGWQVATHAIGDAALDTVLDAYAEAQRHHPRADVRHRVEHCAVASDEQVARLAALGVVPTPQGRFVSEIGDGMLAAMGPQRSRLAYRMRAFLDAGVVLTGSTDAPVVHGAPLLSLHDMVNRRTASGAPFTPEEAVTVEEALRAYTVGSAYAAHEEHIKGTLTPGKLADFVVLSEDPHTIPPGRIKDITVGATIVGGTVSYNDGAINA